MPLTHAGKRIRAAVWQMAIYPIGFAIMLSSSIYVLNAELLPHADRNQPARELDRGARVFFTGSPVYFSEYGVITGIAATALIIWTVWSLPRWHRPDRLRRIFDGLMPWSVYKDIQGATFLLNIGALLQSGVRTKDALEILLETASPACCAY